MPLTIGVLRESAPGESRVALTPEVAAKFIELGVRITLERGAGAQSHLRDDAYASADIVAAASVIDELGPGLESLYSVGERVIVGAITPCGQCFYCWNGSHSQCGGALGGWRFGNTINGAWAEYLLVPDAKANLAPIPSTLADEDVLLCPDIFSTGLSGAESGNVRVGDSVAVFAQGPIGLLHHGGR